MTLEKLVRNVVRRHFEKTEMILNWCLMSYLALWNRIEDVIKYDSCYHRFKGTVEEDMMRLLINKVIK